MPEAPCSGQLATAETAVRLQPPRARGDGLRRRTGRPCRAGLLPTLGESSAPGRPLLSHSALCALVAGLPRARRHRILERRGRAPLDRAVVVACRAHREGCGRRDRGCERVPPSACPHQGRARRLRQARRRFLDHRCRPPECCSPGDDPFSRPGHTRGGLVPRNGPHFPLLEVLIGLAQLRPWSSSRTVRTSRPAPDRLATEDENLEAQHCQPPGVGSLESTDSRRRRGRQADRTQSVGQLTRNGSRSCEDVDECVPTCSPRAVRVAPPEQVSHERGIDGRVRAPPGPRCPSTSPADPPHERPAVRRAEQPHLAATDVLVARLDPLVPRREIHPQLHAVEESLPTPRAPPGGASVCKMPAPAVIHCVSPSVMSPPPPVESR